MCINVHVGGNVLWGERLSFTMIADPCTIGTLTFETNPPIIPDIIDYTVGEQELLFTSNRRLPSSEPRIGKP